MKVDLVTAVLTGVVAAAMAYLYGTFGWLVLTQYLSPMSAVEAIFFSWQVVKVSAIFVVPRLRHGSPLVLADLLFVDVCAIPLPGVLSWATGETAYRDIGVQIFYGWASSLLLLAPGVVIFGYIGSMYRGQKLSAFLPSSALLFGFLASLQGVVAAPVTADGPQALIQSFSAAIEGVPSGLFKFGSSGAGLSAIAAFFSVLVYASARPRPVRGIDIPTFGVALSGILGALGWGILVSRLVLNAALMFTLPTAAIGGCLWWVTREKHI